MPGMGAAPGAAPPMPGMGAGTGPAAHPGPHLGTQQQGLTGVKVGLESLQKALPQLPMGSELHTAVLKAIEQISSKLEKAGAPNDPSAVLQQLVEMARAAKVNPNAQAALPQGAPGAPPGGPPPMMPPMMPGGE